MSLEKAKIDGSILDVITIEEFYRDPAQYENDKFTAIKGNDGIVYPIRSKTDNRPGFYPTGGLDFFKPPAPSECVYYSQQNIINFKEATTLKEVIQAQQKLASEERSILTTIDNVFAPEIGLEDTPEMSALKQAIVDKHIDLDKYEPRIGPNYNNDKRLLRKKSITFGKLRSIANALDMKVTLTIEDSEPDVPNPIGRAIVADITGNGVSEEVGETEE
ncbi:MAG: hypothetical protein NC489_35725 [Ruminococcus flavefaciens]|nr:hypothetical protein [Ruminococcus flavefaciens]